MTKLLNTGWEADRLYKNSVTQTFTSPSRAITITGYYFKLAMIPSDPPVIAGNVSAQVLWHTDIIGLLQDAADDWGTPELKDLTGSHQNLHGGGLGNNMLAASILKASPWVDAVNDVLLMSGMRLSVPAKSTIYMVAGHAGAGPVDFEVQGGILYE